MKSFNEIQELVMQLGIAGDLPIFLLTIFNHSPEDGRAHIELDGENYNYISRERGVEFQRKSTRDLNEILFWIFDDISSNYAFNFEIKNRRSHEDCRRQAFDVKIKTLEKINPDWANIASLHIDEILKSSPFIDGPPPPPSA